MSHTTQKTTVLPQVVHTPAFASIPAREAYLRSVRHPDGRLGTIHRTHKHHCVALCIPKMTTPVLNGRGHVRKRTQIAIAPRGSGVPGMSAPGAGGRLLSSQCAIAPRGMYTGDPSKSALGAGRKGTSHPVTSSQGTVYCMLTSELRVAADPPWQCSPLGCSSPSLRCRCHRGCT